MNLIEKHREVRDVKKAYMWCVTMLFVFASVMSAVAQEGQAERPARTRELAKRFSGEVVSVDAAAKTFVARDGRGEMTFDASTARIAGVVKLGTLKRGDRIAVMYSQKDGRNVARAVGRPMERPRPEAAETAKPVDKPAPATEEKGSEE
jgi:Cu/Ag efflux protein CusF